MEYNVLSLFDGMGCAEIALNNLGIVPTNYYASEIDKYAQIASKNKFPNNKYVGDVRLVDVSKLEPIDLLCGGSPCQSFSFAGKRKGMSMKDSIEILTLDHYLELKKDNFEFEGQSYLFWEYMRILTEIRKYNPSVKFLLENVMMGAKWQKILTQAIGIEPLAINSALVSAQNRKRLYWTNIGAEQDGFFGDLKCMIPQPKDLGIVIRDILEPVVDEKYYIKNPKFDFAGMDINGKNNTLRTGGHQSQDNKHNYDLICVASRGRNPENPKSREVGLETEQQLEPRDDGKTNCLTTVAKDNLIIQINPSKESGGRQPFQPNRIYDPIGIAPCLNTDHRSPAIIIHNMMPRSSTSGKGGTGQMTREDGKTYCLDTGTNNAVELGHRIRRLTPIECCRLQTVPDDYFKDENGVNVVSETQIYKMLGNGWSIKVIEHIFSYLTK